MLHTINQRIMQRAVGSQPCHAIPEGALPGQNDPRGLCDFEGIAGGNHIEREVGVADHMREGLGCRAQISRPVIDDGDGT